MGVHNTAAARGYIAMTLTRILALLLGGFLVMMAMVILRAETTRIETELADLDREEFALRKSLQVEYIEMARWKTPDLIRRRLRELDLAESAPTTTVAPAAPGIGTKKPKREAR